MKYREFGKTGIQVSCLGFGLMRLQVLDKDHSKIDEERASEMFNHAVSSGINYFDTAYPYHTLDFTKGGSSEPFLGKMLRNLDRESIHIATKLPSWLVQSREDMDRLLEHQLERLRSDYIDFYMLHGLNQKMWDNLLQNGALAFLDKAVSDGRIRHVGFSFHDLLPLFKSIVDAYAWDFCQIQYNWYDVDFQAGKEGLEYAKSLDLAVVVMEPLRGGSLVQRLPDEVKELMKSRKPDRSVVEWALRWIWAHQGVSTVLSGMSDMGQLKENLLLANRASEPEWNEMENGTISEARQILNEKQQIKCTACAYCMECPEGVHIPKNFALYNDYYLFDDPAAKLRYRVFTPDTEKADKCIDCGVCVEKCPQQIQIPDELKKVAELFA